MIEELVLGSSEVNLLASAAYAMGRAVHFDITDLNDILRKARTNAPHDGTQAREQFRHRERLRQIIVSPCIEAANAIVLFTARSEHDDGHVARFHARAQ